MDLLQCFVYIGAIGICSFLFGRLLSNYTKLKDWWIFQCFPFEDDGKIYHKLHIRQWQNKVPDMSKIFPMFMPKKKMESIQVDRLDRMIQETCIAELVHALLCVAGLYCIKLWRGFGGVLISMLNILGNAVFIVIQRYNRPRLVALQQRQMRKTRKNNLGGAVHAHLDSQL